MSLALGQHASAIAGQDLSQGLFGVANIISDCANSVRFNKEAAAVLVSRIKDIVSVLGMEQDTMGSASQGEWSAAMDRFRLLLNSIHTDLKEMSDRMYIAQALRRERDAEAIRGMAQSVRDATALFMMASRLEIHVHVQALDTFLESTTTTVFAALTVPAQSLPSPPAYFFGRSAETEHTVTMLDSDIPAYITILGGPGMGKTSLGLAVLHHPTLVTRFGSKRYFVACDAASSGMTFLSLLCAAFDIATSGANAAQRALTSVLHGPSLLFLDNFESAWESPEQRQATETVLGILASIDELSTIVTLRGSERPQGVQWTTPHLPPLSALGSTFASQLFVTMSDIDEDSPDLAKLLSCTDHIPLAIVLMANLAQYESSHELLMRWEEEKTAMLHRSNGSHRLTSMDVSLRLSITSPRVASHPSAVQLLALLSMLPQGAKRSDIEAWFPMNRVGSSISVLLQTALAVWNSTDRLYVLAPIREFMLSMHYPRPAELTALYAHYWTLAQLIKPEGQESSSAEALASVLPELENLYSVTSYGLEDVTHQERAAVTAVNLAYLLVDTGFGSFDIISTALMISRVCDLDNITAALLYQSGILAGQSAAPGNSQILWREAQLLYKKTGNLGGIIDTTLRLSLPEPPEQAVRISEHMYTVAKGASEWRRAARSLFFIAIAHHRIGNFILSIQYQQESVDLICSKLPDAHRLLGSSLYFLGEMFCYTGNLKSGMNKLCEAVPLLMATQQYYTLGEAENAIAESCLLMQKNLTALVHIQQALNAFRNAHDVRGQIRCFHFCVMANLAVADSHSALGAIEYTETLLVGGRVDSGASSRALSLHAKGSIAAARGDHGDAESFFKGAIMVSRVDDSNELKENCLSIEGIATCSLGQLEVVKGNPSQAMTCFMISVAIFCRLSQPELLRTLTYLAQVLEDEAALLVVVAIMPPLLHSGLNGLLADAFLTSANIALRQGNTCLAHYRVLSAMRYLEEVDTVKLHERASTMLEKCAATLIV